MIRELSALLFLGVSGFSDIRKKSIPLYLPVGAMLGAIIIGFFLSDIEMKETFLGIIPGAIFLVISYASSGKVGMGDGLTIVSLGLLCGVWDTVTTLVYASFSSGMVALFLLLAKKRSRNYTMPFLPFLLCGLVLTMYVKRTY